MRARGATVLAVIAAALFHCAAAHAVTGPPEPPEAPEPAEPAEPAAPPGPAPLIGNVTIFNDEIVEPVSLPVSTCGGLLPVLSKSPSTCKDTSRVSDDDA
ncbi:hypothetical protein ABGB18_14995 [Nonomuraea sp. B12E4]|uniref:hypothetical protein n=1 Tax=Nonomuraea sp. B12E4 TaxID=3153564 RepID=UPI00325EDEF1